MIGYVALGRRGLYLSLKAILFLAFILLEKKWKHSHQTKRQNDWNTILSSIQVDTGHQEKNVLTG